MKKQILLTAMSAALLAPSIAPISTLAVDKNAVSTQTAKFNAEGPQKIDKNRNEAQKQQNDRGHDITSEAYASFDGFAKNFASLQSNYGNLGSTNMSPGYKEYLNTISKNKANTALNYRLAAQKGGKYSVSEDGLVLKSDEADKLVNALFSDDVKKQELLNDKEKNNNKKDNLSLSDKVVTNNAFGSNYESAKEEYEDKTESAQKDNLDKFNKENMQNQADKSKAESNAKKQFEEALKKAKEAGVKGEKENSAIAQNYNVVQKKLKQDQQRHNKEAVKIASTTFSSKVAGYEEAKKKGVENGKKAAQAAKKSGKSVKYVTPSKKTVYKTKQNSSVKKLQGDLKKQSVNFDSFTDGNLKDTPILSPVKNVLHDYTAGLF